METGGSLTAPDSVRKLQTALHAKARGSPDFRFYSLSDKVWRADVLEAAWQTVRRNGGAAGVDGETVQRIETQGVERWLGELARDLKEGSYRPGAVRQVLIPKKQAGKYRALGIPCVRDRVAQTAALVVLAPIFEADLEPEQYAYREGCSAQDAVKRVHRLLNRGHREVVDADLSNYFGEIPHAELMRSVARRVSDGRLLGWIKAWLEMPVEEDDGKGGKRRTNQAVDGAQVAEAHFEDGFLSVGVEGIGASAGEGAAVFEVGAGLITRQQAQLGVMRQAVRDGGLFGVPEEQSQVWLAGEHEGHDEATVHFEVGEDPQHGQRFGAQVMGFVEQDDRPHTVAGGMCESVLQLAHQSGIDAGGREAAGDGDFLAQVTLGEAGHLDVMDLEALT